jgi:hypothetical protein
MKHVYKFEKLDGLKSQVITSKELEQSVLDKYMEVLGLSCTYTVEPLGNDVARPVVDDVTLSQAMKVVEEAGFTCVHSKADRKMKLQAIGYIVCSSTEGE